MNIDQMVMAVENMVGGDRLYHDGSLALSDRELDYAQNMIAAHGFRIESEETPDNPKELTPFPGVKFLKVKILQA